MKLNRGHRIGNMLFLLMGLCNILYAQDANLHVYLAFGQSNMSGQGPFTDADKVVDSRFMVLRAANHSGQQVGEFYPGAPRLGHSGSQMGPADFFGRKMVQSLPAEIKVAIANVSIGGQSIALFDKATSASYISKARNANEWWISYLNEYGGDPYQRIIEMGQIGKQKGVIKGILFHQGEADANMSDWPQRVKKVYDDIIADLNLNASEVPILIGELLTTEAGGDLGWRNTAVAQAADLIPNGHLISAAGCPGLVEANYTLHFTREGYEILGGRYADQMLALLGHGVSITAPLAGAVFEEGEPIRIEVDASVANGSVSKVEFKNGTTLLGESTTAPYVFTWSHAPVGSHSLTAVATDDQGKTRTSSPVVIQVMEPQKPYGGSAWTIPGVIEFEHFDVGGNGQAYLDNTSGNEETGVDFRADEDVDIQICSDQNGGYNVGWTTSGEWLEYTVDVTTPGLYSLTIRVACNESGRTLSFALGGTTLASDVAIPNTGDWQTWQDMTLSDLQLSAGKQVLRVTMGAQDYINLNRMTFALDMPLASDAQMSRSSVQLSLRSGVLHAQGVPAGSNIQVYNLLGHWVAEFGHQGGALPQTQEVLLVHVREPSGKRVYSQLIRP